MPQLVPSVPSDSPTPQDARGSIARFGSVHLNARRQELPIIGGIFAWTVVFTLMHKPFIQPERGDPSIYDYIAQSILRGHVPYRDVIDPKAPGSMYLSALALAVGRTFHVSDISAIRLFYILLYGGLSVGIYFLARAFLKDRLAAVLAALVLLLPDRFALMMTSGTQPKLPMMIFGVLALLAVYKGRPLMAGFMSMLSCLCWQPGLLFGGIAFLYFSKYLTSWKDLKALKVVAGAALPLAVTLAYFSYRGAVSDLITWTFTYDYRVYMPTDEKPIRASLAHIWKVVGRTFRGEMVLVFLTVTGLGWYIVRRSAALIKDRSPFTRDYLFGDAVALPSLIYFGFCLINFQSGPDLIPFIPFIGVFVAFLALDLTRLAGRLRKPGSSGAVRWLTAAIIPVLLVIVSLDGVAIARRYKLRGSGILAQYHDLPSVKAYLRPGDKIYTHGSAELLVFLNAQNMNPYVSFDTGAGEYIASRTRGGFATIIAQMEKDAPKIVVMTRLVKMKHRKDLLQWLDEHYDRLPAQSFGAYVRKPAASYQPCPTAGAGASENPPTRH